MSDPLKMWMWELQSLIPAHQPLWIQLQHTLPPAQLHGQSKTGWERGAGTGLETRCCEVHVGAENVAVKGWRDEFWEDSYFGRKEQGSLK